MRRPRLRALSEWLRRLAYRVHPEPLHTLTITTNEGARTFIDCREVPARNCGTCTGGASCGPTHKWSCFGCGGVDLTGWPDRYAAGTLAAPRSLTGLALEGDLNMERLVRALSDGRFR